jgi:asparagine synthase (glutamine-hydrolysing)
MCGICGIFNFDNARPIDRSIIHKMRRSMEHRGPDGQGEYFNIHQNVGLGHQRLGIIDLHTGQQLMPNTTKNTRSLLLLWLRTIRLTTI